MNGPNELTPLPWDIVEKDGGVFIISNGPHSRVLVAAVEKRIDAEFIIAAVVRTKFRPYVGACEFCGKEIRHIPGVNRANKKTCSDLCRKKMHRKRRAKGVA